VVASGDTVPWMFSPIFKGIGLAASPKGRKAIRHAVVLARSEEGRKLIAQARKVATSAESRRVLGEATKIAARAGKLVRERRP